MFLDIGAGRWGHKLYLTQVLGLTPNPKRYTLNVKKGLGLRLLLSASGSLRVQEPKILGPFR